MKQHTTGKCNHLPTIPPLGNPRKALAHMCIETEIRIFPAKKEKIKKL